MTLQTLTGTDNAVPQNLAAWFLFRARSEIGFFLNADRAKGEITHLARFAFACDSSSEVPLSGDLRYRIDLAPKQLGYF